MLIHIFGREDSAGIGPAGPRSSAGPWAANGESFSGIRFQGGKLRSSSLVDRIPLAWEAVGATGTGSGLQGTENLWAAVEGLADMVRELKDNEKLDRENMARSGVYSKWLEAEHVKKSAGSGYAKYGTKQDSIEGALEELDDMIHHYNSICSMQKEKHQE